MFYDGVSRISECDALNSEFFQSREFEAASGELSIYGSSGSPSGIDIKRDYLRKWISAEVGIFVIAVAARVCDAYVGQVCEAIYDTLQSMSQWTQCGAVMRMRAWGEATGSRSIHQSEGVVILRGAVVLTSQRVL